MATTSPRRLQKSRTQRILFGVTGGLAEYFDIDVVIVRVAMVGLAFVGGMGIIMYIALAIFMPTAPETPPVPPTTAGGVVSEPAPSSTPVASTAATHDSGRGRYLAGAVLIVIGGIFLLQQLHFFWWWRWNVLWPVVLIAVGLALIAGRLRR